MSKETDTMTTTDLVARVEALEATTAEHARLLAQSARLFSNWLCDQEEELGEVVGTLDAIRDVLVAGVADRAELLARRRQAGEHLTEEDRDAVLSLRIPAA